MEFAKRRGRKPRPYVCPWDNQTVDGLHRQTDGRWKVIATGFRYTEPDERKAVERFYALTRKARPYTYIPVSAAAADASPDETRMAILLAERGSVLKAVDGDVLYSVVPTATESRASFGIRVSIDEAGALIFANATDELLLWLHVRREIETRRAYVAKMTGIEQIAWLNDLQRREKGDTLIDIGEVYFGHKTISKNELSRSKHFWNEFVRTARRNGVTTVDAVTHDVAHAYEKHVEGLGLSPKSKLHRYRKIRGILRFAIRRGKSIEHCRKTLDVLAMLEVRDAPPLDPTPISPSDFWAVYAEAKEAGDGTFAALLLTALNAALYGGEVASVRWDEIDMRTGGYVSRRPKTRVSRVAMLWPETLAAIRPLDRSREEVFCTKRRSYTVHSVADRFEKYRDAAKVDRRVTFQWIRDASYSTAMQATTFDRAELLAGHMLPGTADSYLRRNPQMVQQACEAIYQAFDVAANVRSIDAQISLRTPTTPVGHGPR